MDGASFGKGMILLHAKPRRREAFGYVDDPASPALMELRPSKLNAENPVRQRGLTELTPIRRLVLLASPG